ncbi:lysophospholipid acyltransferase family protein [Oricola cellulosilytica]|uniref:1-acyl-sn-glycerol-3-phosphate acyltransferase n=1 Tax=Oricola cellulosilytica TaxID=1429082 RepID=A0A4R0PHL3_9HYPH|nr:lysophospholipid acyltransferase family protein [Oricola cellulosilytica]TCD16333.1 1-acyl-sn-glycerol-3-phosphate acyltransferase [Oricola cellulosilytica]
MNGRARLALILGLVVPLTGILLPLQLMAIRKSGRLRRRLPQTWHRIVARLMGLHLRIHGEPAGTGDDGVLIVCNHVSWLDIVALGAAAPVSFVAKEEVSGWPGISLLARLQETVFVDRERRRTAGTQATRIRERLAKGDAVVLFPEGTTSDGNFLLPFKSALFGAAGMQAGETDFPVLVQPVAIAYTHLHGMPMGRFDRPVAAWPGDIELGPHLKGVIEKGAIDATIIFGEPFPASTFAGRKALAAHCEQAVRELVSLALRGRTALLSGSEKR